ncbi:ATR-interacting protein [Cololabis saira]|uniref:ATR-interacting protein n=1 Tax=Cololabis saira TaxID=129043 RepID=UPI002AD33D72|nr:ATR-interacting protein [Cololabis saira]
MNCPPTKRLRGLNQEVVTAFEDPFGDDEEFTQDDLNEIDILASQAITSGEGGTGMGFNPGTRPSGPTRPTTLTKAASNKSRENSFGHRSNAGKPSREPLGNMQQQFESGREDSYRLLEAQHADLKRKLKEVEEGIVLKSGEIQVLRDSLKAAQQQKETQRQNQIQQETDRQKEHSDREKELNRKVQSLQSELQFKEAEINEMKTKLQYSDKNKMASPLARNSPKVLGSLGQMHHGSGSSSSSPVGNGFKEMFDVQTSSKMTPVKTPVKTWRDDRGSSSRSGDRHEAPRPDPFLSVRPAHLQYRGGVLLRLLLQQPLFPSSLGLSHLQAMANSSELSAGCQLSSDPPGAASVDGAGSSRAALNLVQSLAVTGLNLMSQSQPGTPASTRHNRSCPGAVLLLPLLDLHLSQVCVVLDSLRSSAAGRRGSDSAATCSLSAFPGLGGSEEAGPSGFSPEDAGLAALRLLRVLLAHSDEAVVAVLLKETGSTDNKTECSAARLGPCSHNTLLPSLLRLCDTRLADNSSQKDELVLSAVKTLCVLIERTPRAHSERLQCVLQVVCMCVTADSRLQTVSECVSVLSAMSDHEALAKQLCSEHDPCIFLKLFKWIRTRPDNRATHTDWILLDLQVVRLLSRLTQGAQTWMTTEQRTCHCHIELVQTVVIVLHRQWLDIRGSQELMDSTVSSPQRCSGSRWCRSPAASLLRECLLQLHWLLLHHGNFSESCRPLLHMYDQMIPAVRDTLRKIPELSESEELALEDICRSEGDDTDDMDTDTGS